MSAKTTAAPGDEPTDPRKGFAELAAANSVDYEIYRGGRQRDALFYLVKPRAAGKKLTFEFLYWAFQVLRREVKRCYLVFSGYEKPEYWDKNELHISEISGSTEWTADLRDDRSYSIKLYSIGNPPFDHVPPEVMHRFFRPGSKFDLFRKRVIELVHDKWSKLTDAERADFLSRIADEYREKSSPSEPVLFPQIHGIFEDEAEADNTKKKNNISGTGMTEKRSSEKIARIDPKIKPELEAAITEVLAGQAEVLSRGESLRVFRRLRRESAGRRRRLEKVI